MNSGCETASWTGHRLLTILSLAIVILIGGYFILVRWNDLLGQYGVAIPVDNRWPLLLLIPCAQLAVLALRHYGAQHSFVAPMVRKYALGAIILALAVVVSLFPGHGLSNALFMAGMALGAISALYQFVARLIRREGSHRARPAAGSQASAPQTRLTRQASEEVTRSG